MSNTKCMNILTIHFKMYKREWDFYRFYGHNSKYLIFDSSEIVNIDYIFRYCFLNNRLNPTFFISIYRAITCL